MKKLFSILLLAALCQQGIAQQVYNSSGRRGNAGKPKQAGGFDPSRVIFGGGIGLGFGSTTSISVSPVLGYRFTDHFAAGIGLAYQYIKVREWNAYYDPQTGQQVVYPFKASLLSPSVWARVVLFQNIFAQTELEYDIQTYKAYDLDPDFQSPTFGQPKQFKVRYNSPAWLVGLGYRQPVGTNASFIVMALYDVIQDDYSPYKNRIDVRFGFNVGF